MPLSSVSIIMALSLAAYFLLLLLLSRRCGSEPTNEAFFRANRRSPWPMVAFGMVGASISGVSFVSVPGWVASTQMTYLQMCVGFIFGYFAVAFVLLPVYYRLRLTTIYAYLLERFGRSAHKTGTFFFLLSKMTGAAARLYISALVVHTFVTASLGLPYPITVMLILMLVWLYTRRGGIHTIVRTDVVQTFFMLLAMIVMFVAVAGRLGLSPAEAAGTIADNPMSKVFCWDAASPQYFWKQFLSGIFIVVVMTGLDQDMMQKNLTCRTLRESQKNMCLTGFFFVPVNLLLLALGVLLYTFAAQEGITSAAGDELMPALVGSGRLGELVAIPFAVGIAAAAFSSADSAIAALTTSVCVDLLGMKEADPGKAGSGAELRRRKVVHVGVTIAMLACVLVFYALKSESVINAIYVLASYTYAPLLGLYLFGLTTRRSVRARSIPVVCLAAPVVCFVVQQVASAHFGYRFGYELLMIGGLLTYLGLALFSRKKTAPNNK